MPHEPDVDALSQPDRDTEVTGEDVTELRTCGDAMSAPAKTFYHAWPTPRRDGGRHFLGLDL
ncbi:hypothetical protein [Saccharothrix texasensis]|uniref:Uncharacterized protein n=1 Tax=Saccharothrix texasensis TaxID=103734 RepID=A0A3N1H151_9PSEU|nr:hypothetical protein [Saccharothrix texasensis]ROP36002.1 hypothetical protein EDD40_1261 [Saccharothrix texasensis]